MDKKGGFWTDVRSGFTRAVVFQIVNLTLPAAMGLAVLIAGLFQASVPLVYILSAAFITTCVGFGSLAWGLNNFSAWQTRLVEEDSLAFQYVTFDVTRNADLGFKHCVSAYLVYRNNANYNLKCAIAETSFHLKKNDGTGRRDAKGVLNIKETIAHPGVPITFHTAGVVIEDLMQEQSIQGTLSVSVRFGRKRLKHPMNKRFDVFGVRQSNGLWHFRAEKNYV